MANVSYDTLTITIEADSKQANASISRLSTNLRKLDKTAKEIDKENIEALQTLLLDIASIDFTNVSKGLQDVVKAFNAFNSKKFMSATNNGSNLSGAYKTDLTTFANLQGIVDKLDLETPISVADQAIKNYQSTLAQLSENVNNGDWLENFKIELEEVADKEEQVDNNAQQLPTTLNKVSQALKKTKSEAEKNKSAFAELAGSFARILKYRIIRKIIQMIYQALVEGTRTVIEFDENTAQSFNNIMNSAKYLTSALGALIAPLLQIVEPALVMITDVLAEATNGLAELFAEANGQNMFASAIKGSEDFRKSLQKTKSLGIDELNVIGKDENVLHFENKEVDDSVDGLSSIKELLTEIGALVKDVFKTITPILKPVLKLVSAILQSFTPAIKTIQKVWDILAPTILDIITEIIDFLADIFPIITKINEILSPLIVALAQFINGAFSMLKDWIVKLRPVIEAIVNIVAGILVGALGAVVDIVSWLIKGITTVFLVLQGIAETAVKIISFDWGKIGQVWGKIGGRISDVWSNSDWNTVSYATGGFPKEDGLFFANHNELVGQFSNGQTAVANNQQITEGIYQAVLQAMRESGGGNGEVVINLDGYEMARVITKRQNNFGQNLVVGGNINYGK